MSDKALEVVNKTEATSLLQVIAQAVADPRCDVEKMERLLAMQERVVADQRRTAYMAAMARVAVDMPMIGKFGESHHGKYARIEDIDRAIRPVISKEGLSLSFDSEEIGNKVKVTCRLSHSEGHSEEKSITLAVDNSGSKNGAQAIISTVSYGRRALTKMFFNLIEGGEDTDGNNPTPITADQVRDLEAKLTEVGMDRKRFMVFMGVGDLADILAKDWKKAMNACDVKRGSK
jgi:hypothetical protein